MKDFIARWGMGYKHIISMPREEFAALHGSKYLKMGNAMLLKTIKNETPDVDYAENYYNGNWRPDYRVTSNVFKGCQFGVWDDVKDAYREVANIKLDMKGCYYIQKIWEKEVCNKCAYRIKDAINNIMSELYIKEQ